MGELKPGWTRVKFGDVVRLVTDRCADPAAAGIERYVGLEHLEPGDLRIRAWGKVADGTTFTNKFRPGHVLFGKRRSYQRKIAVPNFDGVCSGDIYVFEARDPSVLVPDLLPYICSTDAFFEFAVQTSAGSLSPRTSWRSLANYEFALPPLEQQRRLNAVLGSIMVVEVALQDAQESGRSAATAGMLAGLGVIDGRGPFHSRLQPPNGWVVCKIRELAALSEQPVQVGPFGGSLASRHFTSAGVEVLKVQNVGHDGFVDRTDFVHVAPDYAQTLKRYAVQSRDVVVVAQGFTSGRTAIIRDADAGALISQHLIRVRLDPKRILPEILWFFLRSPLFEGQVAPTMMKTTRPGINTEDILNLVIPVPPIEQQPQLAEAFARLVDTQRVLRTREIAAGELRRTAMSEMGAFTRAN